MLTIFIATVIALSVAGLVLLKSRNTESNQLDQPRPALLAIGVQIICGDCSGDSDHPTKTYMNRYGTCSQCGGTSYLLASAVAGKNFFLKTPRLPESPIPSNHRRRIPLRTPPALPQ